METFRTYFKEEISDIQNHITTNFKSALTQAVKKLHIRQHDTLAKIQSDIDKILKRNMKPLGLHKNDANKLEHRGRQDDFFSTKRGIQSFSLRDRYSISLMDGNFVSSRNVNYACLQGDDSLISISDEDKDKDMDNVSQYGAYIFSLNGDKDEDNCPHECTCIAYGPKPGQQCIPF